MLSVKVVTDSGREGSCGGVCGSVWFRVWVRVVSRVGPCGARVGLCGARVFVLLYFTLSSSMLCLCCFLVSLYIF